MQLHATIALRSGKPQDAWQSIGRSLALRPGHLPSLILAARVAREAGMPDRAVPLLRQAVARAPDQAEPAFLLCRALLDLNDPSPDATLAWVAHRHPSPAAEWLQLGRALQHAQQPAPALAAFTRAGG
jgi:predicted Zn-dependent protease